LGRVEGRRLHDGVANSPQLPHRPPQPHAGVQAGGAGAGRPDALTGKFDTDEFPDTYASNLRGLIAAKQAGTAAPVVEKQAPAPLTVDLMAALQASINAAKARQGGQPVAVAEQLIAEKAAEASSAAKFAIN